MGIFTAIGTAIAGALFGGSLLAGSIISAGLAFGARLLVSYFNRPKERKYTAVQGQVEFGGDIPVDAAFGIVKTRGQRLFYAKAGKGDKYNAEVFALSNGWCDGLEPYIYFYGKKHNLIARPITGNETACYGVQGYQNDGYDRIVIRFYDGRPTQEHDIPLVAATATAGKTWKTTSRLRGVSYVVVERTYTPDLFSDGAPEFDFVFRGLRCYDWRKDSTVAGGSGTHRINDSSTWEFTENPAVQRFNYQLGIRGILSTRTIIGEGKSIGQLDLSSYTVAANVCDQERTVEGRTFARYKCALIVKGTDDHTEVLKEFDDAMAGYGLNRRGLSGVIPGAPQIPVAELTKADIPADRGKEIRFRKSAFELYNNMSGQFISQKADWEPASLTPIKVNADEAADGRVRQTNYDFLQVSDPDIAQYLLQIRYRQQRLGGSATVPVSRRFGFDVLEGQWITWRGKTWLVNEWRADENINITLGLVETSEDIYDEGTIDPGPVVVPSPPSINPSQLSSIQNFAVEVGAIEGSDNQQVPALRFTWTPPDDPTMVEIIFEYVIGTDPLGVTVYEDRTSRVETGEYITSKNVQPGVFYTARAIPVTRPDRFRTFTNWLTTATVTAAFEIYPPGLIEDIQELIGEGEEWVRSGVRDLIESARQISVEEVNSQYADYFARQQIRREVNVVYDRVTAEYSEVITVQIDEVNGNVNAVSQRLEELEVTVADDIASAIDFLQTQITEVDGDVTAAANAITALFAALGGNSAQVNVRMAAVAAPSGYSARFALEAKTTVEGTFRSASMFLDVPSTPGAPTRIAFVADQFVITNGSNTTSPFVFESGIARLNVANIGTVNAGVVQSLNGKVVFNLTSGTLTMDD